MKTVVMIKKVAILPFIFCAFFSFAQEKETIYLNYDSLRVQNNFEYNGLKGISFGSWRVNLFFDYKKDSVLIDNETAKEIKTLSYAEIQTKQGEITYKKYKRYIWDYKNPIFNTYVIKFENAGAIIYPVIWINEGLQM